jgi:hypothetical protein
LAKNARIERLLGPVAAEEGGGPEGGRVRRDHLKAEQFPIELGEGGRSRALRPTWRTPIT